VQQKEDEIMKELESLDKISGELERENDKLEWQENQLEVTVYEEYRKIVSLLEDNNAGQNTDVQGASAHAGFPDANADVRINFFDL
jgi:division protein CdvB (Snf7/Vps24/ESCRT-III family)